MPKMDAGRLEALGLLGDARGMSREATVRLLRESERENIFEPRRFVPLLLFLLRLGAVLFVSEDAADADAEK